MRIKPLTRSYAPALLNPNPMWTISGTEKSVLENTLLPLKDKNGKPYLYGAIDCWDENIEKTAIRNIRVLSTIAKAIQPPPKMALLTLHREPTIKDEQFIDIDGIAHKPTLKHTKSKRQYFDGTTYEEHKLGHVCAACIDYERHKIWMQDPQGIPIKTQIREAFQRYFPDFQLTDHQKKQQWDAHSCSVLTMHNLENFSRRIPPSDYVDINQLRQRYTSILDAYDLQQGQTNRPTRYYQPPVINLRYTPI